MNTDLRLCLGLVTIAFLSVGCSHFYSGNKDVYQSSQEPSEKKNTYNVTKTENRELLLEIDKQISEMPLKQKIGQMFIFGFSGTNLNSSLANKIKKYKPGAIIVFKRNISKPLQIAKLNQAAQRLSNEVSGQPLLIMIDQEGGAVSRIRTKPGSPSALSIGSIGDAKFANKIGVSTGRLLNILGFNMNLAPVVDLSDPEKWNFIGNRSFGDDPEMVKALGESYSYGLIQSGILPTLKHFPGHGGLVADSHKTTPSKNVSIGELKRKDLVPFAHFADLKTQTAVMVAHLSFPQIDPSMMPATFSEKLVSGLLVDDLGFEGLIITDDIEMHGASTYETIAERTVAAVKAGNDMVMVAWTLRRQREAFNALYKAVVSGEVSEERIDRSLKKILAAKRFVVKRTLASKNDRELLDNLRVELNEIKKLSTQTARTNFRRSIAKNPILTSSLGPQTKVHVFSADRKFSSTFVKSSVKKRVKSHFLSRRKMSNINKVLAKDANSVGVYYVSGLGTAKKLLEVSEEVRKRLIVINSTTPGSIRYNDEYLSVINLNSKNYKSAQWIAELIFDQQNVSQTNRD